MATSVCAQPVDVHAVEMQGESAVSQDRARESASEIRRGNICFGGLDDGKLIPNDDQVDNPFKQTTLLGCSVEGGAPVYLPDLKPAFPNGVLA